MGHLEDELEKLRQELDALDTANYARTAAERQQHLQKLIGDISRGDDLGDYDPDEVERVRASLTRYGVAAQRVLDRITASGARLGQDGGLKVD